MPHLTLPQEIIDLIIDGIQDDTDALEACSLVSHAFYPRTRVHLFRDVVLGDSGKPKTRCTALRKLLEDKPSLRHYIRSLTLVENAKQHKSDYADGWLKRQMDLVTLLHLLTSISEISIKNEPEFLNWSLVPPELKIALYDVFARPTVARVELENILHMEITPFVHYHQLKRLALNNVGIDPREQAGQFPLNRLSSPSTKPLDGGLEVLDVGASGFLLTTLLSSLDRPGASLDVSRVKELWVSTRDFGQDMVGAWETILTLCASSVEKYYVTQGEPSDTDPFPDAVFAFQRFSSLRSLDINLTPFFFNWTDHNPLSALVLGLQYLSRQPNILQSFSWELDYRPTYGSRRPAPIDTALRHFLNRNHFWPEFDSIFCRENFTSLSVVDIKLDLTFCHIGPSGLAKVLGAFKARLPLLTARGILNVETYRQVDNP